MKLPINEKELNTIVNALSLGGDVPLYQKLKTFRDLKDANPDYIKMVMKETYGVEI